MGGGVRTRMIDVLGSMYMYDAADYCALRRECRGLIFRQLLPEA